MAGETSTTLGLSERMAVTDDTTVPITTDEIVTSSASGMPFSGTLPPIFVSLCGLFGNAFVIVIICKFKKLRRRLTSVFLLNQSLADLIASLLTIGHYITRSLWDFRVLADGVMGDIYCRLWLSACMVFGAMLVSTFNLVAITTERYLMVVHPIYHMNYFKKGRSRALIMIGCTWLFGIGYNAFWAPFTSRFKDNTCTIFSEWPDETTKKFYAILNMLLHLCIPLAIMGYMYSRMVVILRMRPGQNQVEPTGHQGPHKPISRVQMNLIKTLVMVVVAFFICWTPNQIYWVLFNFGYVSDPAGDIHAATVTLAYINGCINPFIYIFKYEEFRQGVRKMFGVYQGGESSIVNTSRVQKT